VATDDLKIRALIETAGGEVFYSDAPFRNGSERCAAAVAQIDCDIVVNIQGDEVMIEPEHIDAAVRFLEARPELQMSTIAFPIAGPAVDRADKNLVKVAVDANGCAIDFSRQPINTIGAANRDYGHAGIYVYRKDFLLRYAQLPPTPRETAESLEQLRVLESGYSIGVTIIDKPLLSVNSPEDLEIANNLLRDEGGINR
jgi:3-deoxy-manno-octulosonate cytidylyltransferase (CMP-KDO synthetase)